MAEEICRQQRLTKQRHLQSGGVLTVAQGRSMIQQREENELQRAQRIVNQAHLRYQKLCQKAFSEAAKKAKKFRLEGRLQPMYLIDETGYGRTIQRG